MGTLNSTLPAALRLPANADGIPYRRLEALAALARTGGGFTAYPNGRQLITRTGYAVSPYPDRTERINIDHFGPGAIRRFIDRNADLLGQPDHYVGAWHANISGQDQVWLDVSVWTPDLFYAATLAHEHNQQAIFDLAHTTDLAMVG